MTKQECIIQPGLKLLIPITFGKMIPLYIRKQPLLVVTEMSMSHGECLETILMEARISFKRECGHDGSMHPKSTGRFYEAVGMGFASIEEKDKFIELSGHSVGYDLYPNQNHVVRVQPYIPHYILRIMK